MAKDILYLVEEYDDVGFVGYRVDGTTVIEGNDLYDKTKDWLRSGKHVFHPTSKVIGCQALSSNHWFGLEVLINGTTIILYDDDAVALLKATRRHINPLDFDKITMFYDDNNTVIYSTANGDKHQVNRVDFFPVYHQSAPFIQCGNYYLNPRYSRLFRVSAESAPHRWLTVTIEINNGDFFLLYDDDAAAYLARSCNVGF